MGSRAPTRILCACILCGLCCAVAGSRVLLGTVPSDDPEFKSADLAGTPPSMLAPLQHDGAVLLSSKAALKDALGELSSWTAAVSEQVVRDAQPVHCQFWGVTCDGDGAVTEIDVSYSALSGSLPPSLGELPGLRRLFVNSNDFSGTVPATWGDDMGSLQEAALFDNRRLSGCLPAKWKGRVRFYGRDSATPTADVFSSGVLAGTQITGWC